MTTEIAQKLEGIRDFKKILETVVKELGETYAADVSQIVLSNPLDHNLTSICEYKLYPEANAEELPVRKSFPLPLEGRALGSVTLTRRTEFHENELNWIRITLSELSDVLRFAQINDVVQRDTFRNTFVSEIVNVMQYSLGIGDALFMVVNILGKVLNTSRCLVICLDDEKSVWKCYEFWQREKIESCQVYGWPTTDSPIVARSLLTSSPMTITEANETSRPTPVQEELSLLGVRSLLGVPLKSESATHGCIILQHCDIRHEWMRGEIDMVQYVADTIAEALVKLPEEKRAREPIMRLHQRDVVTKDGEKKESILAVRRALRGAFTNNSIPSAGKSGQPAKAALPAASPAVKSKGKPVADQPQVAALPDTPAPAASTPAIASPIDTDTAEQIENSVSQNMNDVAASIMRKVNASADPATAQEVNSTLHGLLQSMGAAPAKTSKPQDKAPSLKDKAPSDIPPAAQVQDAGTKPQADNSGGQWGNLDSIPTPPAGSARAGLGGAIFNKKPSPAAAQSPLLAALHKDKSKFQQPAVEYLDGGVIEVDEAQAEAKFKEALSASNATSDYIFATAGLDARMLGRIDGWVSQVEQKDKYESPHAIHVAEYSVAIGRIMNLPTDELQALRIAGILHDVGKLGLSPQVLQRPPDELSDSEMLLVMKHPIDGAKLVEGFPEIAYLAPVILSHHEEFDGNGFPAGLSGEEIPLLARILHVASEYHGLVTPTHGHAAISQQEALQALRSKAGKTFDPQVVEALAACVIKDWSPPPADH